MQRPRREEFILDVRRAAKMLQKPDVEGNSDAVNMDAVSKILHGAALWLTPKVVERYGAEDFADWQKDQQDRLSAAVEQFREIAKDVPPKKPATVAQYTEGGRRFRHLIDVLGEMVLEEWMQAIHAVEKQAEAWSAEAEWRTRRVNKKVSESLIGIYDAPQLLIFAEPNLYVLDPLARFIPGGQGSFDIAIQPSYYTTSLYRDDALNWYVHLEIRNGFSHGKRVPWDKDAFRECLEQLRVFV